MYLFQILYIFIVCKMLPSCIKSKKIPVKKRNSFYNILLDWTLLSATTMKKIFLHYECLLWIPFLTNSVPAEYFPKTESYYWKCISAISSSLWAVKKFIGISLGKTGFGCGLPAVNFSIILQNKIFYANPFLPTGTIQPNGE